MNRSKILIFFFFFTFRWLGADAQDTILNSREIVHSVIVYDPTGSPRSAVSNSILREIAQNEVISLKKIRLNFESAIRLVILRYGNDLYLKFAMDHLSCSGDHFYRKFSFTEAAHPALGLLSIQLRSSQDSLIIREINAINVRKGNNDSILLAGLAINGNDTRFHISVEDLLLFCQAEDLDDFHDYRRLVDDYYACAAVIDSLDPVMRSMDFRQTSHYPEYYIGMIEIGRIDRLTGERDFPGRLSPPGFDPRDMGRKYANLLRFSRSFAITFESVLDTLPVLNTSVPEKTLTNLYVEMIRRYIRWSFLINERNGSIYREYLDRFYELNAFGNDYAALVKLVDRTYPGLNADSICRDLLTGLKKAYEINAGLCTDSLQFAEAVELLDHLRLLEEKYPFLKDKGAGKDTRAIAAYGIYASYLGVAENSLKKGRPFIAWGYIDKALKYAETTKGLVRPDSLYDRLIAMYRSQALTECDAIFAKGDLQSSLACYLSFLNALDSENLALFRPALEEKIARTREGIYQQMMTEAKSLAENRKADSALIVYDQAVTTLKQIPEAVAILPVMDSLKPVIDQYRYSKLVRDAGEFCMGMNYRKSYEALAQATVIADQQQLPADPLLDSLRGRVYPRYVDELLAGARPLIWANRFKEAGEFADSLEQFLDRNGFSDYPEVKVSLYLFRKRIADRICWLASDRVNELLIRSGRYVAATKFATVIALLDSAMTIIKANPSCMFADNSVTDSLRRYNPPAQYQGMLQKLDGQVSLGEYSGFMAQFNESQQFFTKNSLERFGLSPVVLFDYAEGKSREGLTFEILKFCIAQKDYQKSFRYLALLRKQGADWKPTKEIQSQLGKELAAFDSRGKKEEVPDSMLKKYTEGDEWFRTFEDSYRKEWGRRRENNE